MGVFFAVIGASAGSLSCLAACGPLAAFLCVMVAVHWAVMAVGGGAEGCGTSISSASAAGTQVLAIPSVRPCVVRRWLLPRDRVWLCTA